MPNTAKSKYSPALEIPVGFERGGDKEAAKKLKSLAEP
jgi:hypothetical protein